MMKTRNKIQNFLIKITSILGTALSLVLVFAAALLFFSIRWMFDTWSNLSMDELVYHLTAPLDGTNMDMVYDYMNICAAPAILLVLIFLTLYAGLRGKKKYYILIMGSIIVSVSFGAKNVLEAADKLDASEFVKSKGESSSFIEDYYVSPKEVELLFPEQKRNLIYIFLESMENTYADRRCGGAFEKNAIPELTELSLENENFSGDQGKLNGGYALKGATWTIAAMFSQTAGIPLNISIEANSMDTQETFFQGAVTLGDILEQAGYSQTLMLGSDATFGGRRLYFSEHGDYTILDYNYALENGGIPKDYRVWWGFEDQKLFEFAKNKLRELEEQDEPFNLTLLTVDTHFEDGFVCDLCPDTFDEQYANVMACSSAQVNAFVEWVEQQDFYDNTTIVICGDHLTMDKDFCEEVASDYDRKVYTAVINPATEKKINQYRTYSTFDIFPTTLAALGVQIEGNRLGLGTNLFSDRPTISEKIGIEAQEIELGKKSEFLERLAELDEENELLLKRTGKYPQAAITVDTYNFQTGALSVHVSDIANIENGISSVTAAVWTNEDQSDLQWVQMGTDGQGIYSANINVANFGFKLGEYRIQVHVVDDSGEEYTVGEAMGVVN